MRRVTLGRALMMPLMRPREGFRVQGFGGLRLGSCLKRFGNFRKNDIMSMRIGIVSAQLSKYGSGIAWTTWGVAEGARVSRGLKLSDISLGSASGILEQCCLSSLRAPSEKPNYHMIFHVHVHSTVQCDFCVGSYSGTKP